MFLQKLIPGNRQLKLAMLVLVMMVLACLAGACQVIPTKQTTGTVEKTNPTQELADPTEFPPGFPTPDAVLYAACLAEGGRWEVLGFSGPGCNFPTTDGGKACRDSVDCESGCLADPDQVMKTDETGRLIPDGDRISELNSQDIEQVGLCSPWKENFGCRVWLEKGRYVEICID
ncbi:MAG: hypothetical protein WA997_00365 [Anaerolineales bacterium]